MLSWLTRHAYLSEVIYHGSDIGSVEVYIESNIIPRTAYQTKFENTALPKQTVSHIAKQLSSEY